MENKKIIIISVIIAVVILVGVITCLIFLNNDKLKLKENVTEIKVTEDLDLIGEEYSPSKIYDDKNNEVNLSNFSDKPIVLLFFNTTELATTNIIEILQKNYDNYKDKVNFVNVCVIDGVTETKEDVKTFIESKSITMPVLYDIDYSAKNEYNIDTIPTIVFINKNNEVINTISGEKSEDVIQANLDIISENY